MIAVSFIYTDDLEQRERIRGNWEYIGYEYWTRCDMVEMWKHPKTGHVAQTTTY